MTILTIISLLVAVAAAIVAILAISKNRKLQTELDRQTTILLQKLREKQTTAVMEVEGPIIELTGNTVHVKGNLVADGYISAGM